MNALHAAPSQRFRKMAPLPVLTTSSILPDSQIITLNDLLVPCTEISTVRHARAAQYNLQDMQKHLGWAPSLARYTVYLHSLSAS